MLTNVSQCRVALQTIAVTIVGLGASMNSAGQGSVPPVEKVDLGNGLWGVSVRAGPPALIDQESGMILKSIAGWPALVDKQSGVMLYSPNGGDLTLIDISAYGKGGGGQAPKAVSDPDKLNRMKESMKRMEAGGKEYDKETRFDLSKYWEARAARYREMLGVSDEEWEMIVMPFLKAILMKQDEIRRSTLDVARLMAMAPYGKGKAPDSKNADLPSAIEIFQKDLQSGKKLEVAQLERRLADFRTAREKQDEELKDLRAKLRGVLTVLQEARLTAVGVLD